MRPATSPCRLTDRVHVWSVKLAASDSTAEYYVSTLSSDERLRASRSHFEHLQRAFMLRRGVLRLLLGYYLGEQPSRVELVYGRYGKPVLAGPSRVHFNSSHSGDSALFGIHARL